MNTQNKQFLSHVVFLVTLCATPAVSALSLDLGLASDFNTFVLGNMTSTHSDVEGRLAVGGDLNLDHYGIGAQLSNSYGTRDDLIVGGSLNIYDSRIYNGNAVSGVASSIPSTVGFYADANVIDRDPITGIVPVNGSYSLGNPIDFASVAQTLRDDSTSWAALSSNGSVSDNAYGNIELTGTGLFNIFSVSAAELLTASSFWLNIPENSSALINVDGTFVSMRNFGFFRTVNGQRTQIPDNSPDGANQLLASSSETVLFNFVEATTLELSEIGIKGSVLAPFAATNFYNSQVDGNLIVSSLTSPAGENTGQVNYFPLHSVPVPPTLTSQVNTHPLHSVPEPAALTLIGLGLAGMAVLRRR